MALQYDKGVVTEVTNLKQQELELEEKLRLRSENLTATKGREEEVKRGLDLVE